MNPKLLHLLNYLFYLKIALIPGLAVIGYFIATEGWRWTDDARTAAMTHVGRTDLYLGLAFISGVVMMFASVLFFLVINVSKAPVHPVALTISVLQLPLLITLWHHFSPPEIGFWRACVGIMLLEMNALLLAVLALKFIAKISIAEVATIDASAEGILVGYFIATMLLFNVSTYGLLFWHDTLSLGTIGRATVAAALLIAAWGYYQSFRQIGTDAGEATRTIGSETISGIVLVPTWGMLLFIIPLSPIANAIVKAIKA